MMEEEMAVGAFREALRGQVIDADLEVVVRQMYGIGLAVFGGDRCVCRQGVHQQHHLTEVPGCPWCAKTSPGDRKVSEPETATIRLTGDLKKAL